MWNSSTVRVFLEGKVLLFLPVILLLQTLLLPTSAMPAKAGASSKSLEVYTFPFSSLQEASHKTSPAEQNLVVSETPKDSLNATPNYKITVFPWNNHLGRPAPLEWTEVELKELQCKDIPQRWRNKVRSVDTHNNCAVLYEGEKCTGSFKVMKVGSPSHNRLSDICFQRKPITVRPCTPEEVAEPIKERN